MEIHPNALKRGISESDIRHAAQNAIAQVSQDDRRLLLIGAAHDGTMLEIVVADPDDEPIAIHAMKLRTTFHRYLP